MSPTSVPPALSRRALNRATLRRQWLLGRARHTALAATEHLVGLQAQTPHTWYVGLWSRIEDCRTEDVGALLLDRRAVRIALMRSTVHFVSAADALALRPVVQPVLDRDLFRNHTHGRWMRDLDTGAVVRYARTLPPLTPLSPETLVLRYLAAYGPATVQDVQAWCGLTRLGEVVDRLRPRLVEFADGYVGLPEAPRPDPDIPAPVRYLYDFDNVLLSHRDREALTAEGLGLLAFHGAPEPYDVRFVPG